MALTLITAAAGAGKTQYVIEQIQKYSGHKPLARVLIILPSGGQLVALRERIGALPRPTFGVLLTDFHTLYHDILDAADAPPRLLPEAARYRVVRAMILLLAGIDQLPYFARIADKPGFITATSRFIADLKEGRVQPETFSALANTPRVSDLASIYAAYQDFLRQHNLADREGMGWLALASLQADAQLFADFDYIAADGFDEFNPTQFELLNLLAARVPALDVTLTYQPRRRAHVRFQETFQKFASAAHIELTTTVPRRAAALDHLEQNLFESNAPRMSAEQAVTLTTAPDRTQEVRAIGREVKRLLLGGAQPSQIGVVVRRLQPYQSIIREVFAEFGIPYRVREGLPLADNPLIAALLNLLTLSSNEFPWRETLDALRSPYFLFREPNVAQVAQIERIIREAVVVRGRGAWFEAFAKPTEPPYDDERDTRLVRDLGADEIQTLRAAVENFFPRVTSPARATTREFVAWVEALMGPDPRDEAWQREHSPDEFQEDTASLRILDRAREGEPELAARDLAALVEFKNVLRGLVEAAEVLGEGEGAWSEFVTDLLDAINAATYDLTPMLDGRVVVASVTQARGVPKAFIFLGGLVEREFPIRAPEDPLLLTAERDALRAEQIPLADLKTRDETTLFYEIATLARQQLYLSYPYLDDDANPLFPSPYIAAVQQLFTNLTGRKLRVNVTPPVDEAASFNELALALAAEPISLNPHARFVERALWRESPAWRHSRFALAIEARREAPAACDEYSGVIRDPMLRAEVAAWLDGHRWSATQFNEWGACGFRFFARRMLKLEELVEPAEGMEARQLGSVYHKILEETYREFAVRRLAVTAETLEEAHAILLETAERILADAPRRFAFRETAWWRQERDEIVRTMHRVLETDAKRKGKASRQPYRTEVEFNLELAGAIRVAGQIDRIDLIADGYELIDYKSGTTKISAQEVFDGRNLQLPVYWLAAEQLGYRVVDAFFWHIADEKVSGSVRADQREEWLDAARHHIASFVAEARDGAFAVKPARLKAGACSAYCEFASLCRVGPWSAHKGESADA